MSIKRSPDDDLERLSSKKSNQSDSYGLELPSNPNYKYSYMHKAQITTVHCITNSSDNVVATGSLDGVVKFWMVDAAFAEPKFGMGLNSSKEDSEKEEDPGKLNFIKHYQLFKAPIVKFAEYKQRNQKLVAVLLDYSSVKRSKYPIYVFDLRTFDMITMLELQFKPGDLCWADYQDTSALVISNLETSQVSVFCPFDEETANEPKSSTAQIHRYPIRSMEFVDDLNCLLSIDTMGMIEYWRLDKEFSKPKAQDFFESKSSTDLLSLRKLKLKPLSRLSLSHDQRHFAMIVSDFNIWVFDIFSGKIVHKIEESVAFYEKVFGENSDYDKKKRITVEKEVTQNDIMTRYMNVTFYKDRYLSFPTAIGIKFFNIVTGKTDLCIGGDEKLRFLDISILTFDNKRKITDLDMLPAHKDASKHLVLQNNYSFLFASAYHSQRFFIFNNTQKPFDENSRDIYNEDPTQGSFEEVKSLDPWRQKTKYSNTKVILHTTLGDIKMKMLPKYAPLSVQNFMELCLKNYYNNLTFHRIVKGFMIQTGDPNGDGSGGESAWGTPFEMEINQEVKHDKPFLVSMAHGASQFFISLKPAPWLDGKHSIFAKVYEGFDVIRAIEDTKDSDPVPKILSTTIDKS